MAFFPITTNASYSSTALTDNDYNNAKNLCWVIYQDRRLTRRPSLKRWAYDLHLLLNDLSFDQKRLTKVLNWYIKHSKNQFTPTVHSARMFRDKFTQIEAAMMRQQKETKSAPLDKACKSVISQLSHLDWPKGFKEQIPNTVQISMTNCREFLYVLKIGAKKSFYRYVMEQFILSLTDFITQWFLDAHARVSDWPEWSGCPASIMFTVDSKQFKRTFLYWTREWGYTEDISYALLKKISK